jgi:hypothetical protein
MPPLTGREKTLKIEAAGSSATSIPTTLHGAMSQTTVILCERSWDETSLNSKDLERITQTVFLYTTGN